MESYNVSQKSLERKAKSEKILASKGINYNKYLPVIEDETEIKIRSSEEIGKRAVALAAAAVRAECRLSGVALETEKELITGILEIYNGETFFSKEEKWYMDNPNPSEHDSIQFIWRYEAMWVMLWALGYVEKLEYPDKICDVSHAANIISMSRNLEELIKTGKKKSKEEIVDEADLIYRYNWACVDARIKGVQTPGGMDEGIVMERHKALNWIINYMNDDWDNVRTDT